MSLTVQSVRSRPLSVALKAFTDSSDRKKLATNKFSDQPASGCQCSPSSLTDARTFSTRAKVSVNYKAGRCFLMEALV